VSSRSRRLHEVMRQPQGRVTDPGSFFDAQSAAPDAAKTAIDFILDVYRIERAALDADRLGCDLYAG
jgi:hypothetical protein